MTVSYSEIVGNALRRDMLSIAASVLLSILFFIVYPGILIDGKGAINSISSSVNHFIANKVQVFLIWILSAAINVLITFVSAIPLIAAIWFSVLTPEGVIIEAISSLGFIAALMIFLVGSSLGGVFFYGVLGRYYYEVISPVG